ncbi:PP0621 family protein [Pseudoduganella danionis]|uniref:PP0621 family protein n=1 Tax=Pseudoduganella danionis TaxID=1890295 RepID=UPI0035B035C3
MSRLLFWLALIFLVGFAIRSKIREAQKRQQPFDQPPPAGAGPAPGPAARQHGNAEVETMLQCAHCGVFYPASETVQARGRDYCSAAHAAMPPA